MANHGQLTILTSGQIAALLADTQRKCAELVKVYWPSPDGPVVYSWWDCLSDAAYTTPLTTWLAGASLIPAFAASDPRLRFHEIPRTSAIGDDVVSMRFSNVNRTFEQLCYTHRGGVKVEIFLFFPEIDGGTAISWWLGHLRTPDNADRDWVNVTAATGFRSADLLLPNRPSGANCTFYFGGELTQAEIDNYNPCKYDRHLSGSRGTLNGTDPWTFCEHTKAACLRIMGDTLSYGGDDTAVESTLIGAGQHKTVSTTVGNESRLKDPKRVIYGSRKVRQLRLMAYAKEFNPSEDHQDKGTLRTLFEVSEGPVQAISNVKVLDRAPQGLVTRTGELDQAATIFSPSVLNYSHLAHFQANLNPIDPATVNVSQLTAECDVVGRDTIRVYSDNVTYVEQYTNNRAWCLLDLLTNQWYGHRLDHARYDIDDFIYLAALTSPFNADVQGARTAQQQIYDICLAGRWYLPFNHNGITRILPIEDVDLEQADIPVFTDTGTSRNILYDRERSTSRLRVAYKDDDKIPNAITLTFEDAAHDNIERPLLFEDWPQQYRAGLIYGDKSKRRVERPYAAFGLTDLAEAVPLGDYLISVGPFGTGGIKNNCSIQFAIDATSPDALDLHENKVVKIVSPKLAGYVDQDDNQFEFFLVTGLVRTSNLELIITAQAYARTTATGCRAITWTNLVQAVVNPGNILEKTAGFNECYIDASGTGDAGAWSVEEIEGGGDWEVSWTFGPITGQSGRSFLGLTSGAFSLDFTTWDYTLHVSTEENISGTPHPANSVFVYEGAPPNVAFEDALLTALNGGIDASVTTITVTSTTGFLATGMIKIDNEKITYTGKTGTTFTGCTRGVRGTTAASHLTAATVFQNWMEGDTLRIRCVNEVVSYLHGDTLLYTSAVAPTYPLRVITSMACLNKTVEQAIICLGTSASDVGTGGSSETTQTIANTDFVFVDRLWREAEKSSGVPGIFVAGAPNSADSWVGYELHRDKGAGYIKLGESLVQGIVGGAATVLADTQTGAETVDITLVTPDEVLASYTAGQVTAGAGYVALGNEIFQYQTATQQSTTPNVWRLSVLSNRGAFCSPLSGHIIGDRFAVLAQDMPFFALETTEIGQARDFKVPTIGQAVASALPYNYTFNSPSHLIETPSDYDVTFDSTFDQVVHSWTLITDTCLVLTDLIYEIYSDLAGSPDALLWSGNANEWRQSVTPPYSATYHFRAKTRYYTSGYVVSAVDSAAAALDVLEYQVFDRPEDEMEVEVFS